MLRDPPHHLILVCCHAIYHRNSDPSLPPSWLLAPFQTHDVPAFISHIKRGLQLCSSSSNLSSLLIFSGGPTRPETGLSEAASYLNYCIDNNYLISSIRSSILLEEKALDSYHNLLFSMLLFWKQTGGTWPRKITIVSHEFKRARFMELHVPALRLGGKVKVEFVGIDPEYMAEDPARGEEVKRGEMANGYAPWESDPHGRGEVLSGKRRRRNCWRTSQVWFDDEEERGRSGVKSEILEWVDGEGKVLREEVLREESVQPWE